jgi:uncharacterized protein
MSAEQRAAAGPGAEASGNGDRLQERFPGKYLSVTSFKRDGNGVATPVWFVVEDGRLLFQTDPDSFKMRRIRRDPAVTVAPCSASGRAKAAPVRGRAQIVPAEEFAHVEQLLARKYRVDRILILPVYRLVQRLRGRRPGGAETVVAITPE